MIETLIGLIFLVIIIGVFWWAATTLLRVIPLAEPFRTVVTRARRFGRGVHLFFMWRRCS